MATEKRLIDANMLYEKATNAYDSTLCDECYSEIINLIDEAPTVDAVEVVHGRWNTNFAFYLEEDLMYTHKCLVCGYNYDTDQENGHNYCPNCGAKMDGDRNENV